MSKKALRLPASVLDKPGYSLHCLPVAGVDLILAIAQRLTWSIYQDDEGNSVRLTDAQAAKVDELIGALIMPCEFPDYSEAIESLAEAISNLRLTANCAPDVTVNCGGGGGDWIVLPGPGEPPIVNPGPLPDSPIDPDSPFPLPPSWPENPLDPETDPPPYGETWEEYDSDACRAANALVNATQQAAYRLQEVFVTDLVTLAMLVLAINAVASAGVAVLFTREFIIELARSAWRLFVSSSLVEVSNFFGEIGDWVSENKGALVCFLYRSRVGGLDAMNEYIAESWNFLIGTALYASSPTAATAVFRLLFADNAFQALIDAGVSYEPPDPYDCSQCEHARLSWEYPLQSDYEIFINNGGVSYTVNGDTWNHATVGSIGYYEGWGHLASVNFLNRVGGDRIVASRVMFTDEVNPTNTRIKAFPIDNAATITPSGVGVGVWYCRYRGDLTQSEVDEVLAFLSQDETQGTLIAGWQSASVLKFRSECYSQGDFNFRIQYLVMRDE